MAETGIKLKKHGDAWEGMVRLAPETQEPEVVVTIPACACDRDISLDELLDGFSNLGSESLFSASSHGLAGTEMGEFLGHLNVSMKSYGIASCIDKAHFLAQVAIESDRLRTTEEYRNRDGSHPSGWDNYSGGAEYHGRGLIQLTHDHNYRKYSEHAGIDCVSNPEIVAADLSVAVDSSCWYWRHGSAWGDLSPRAKSNDFVWATMGVNGGFNHYSERLTMLQELARAFDVAQCLKYGSLDFSTYKFSASALNRTRNGPVIWRKYFGERDEA
ncbi:glycoside hydrolase family 19 protein [Novilysobacter erysipheiresistens]|uniref:Glycoside hydrolase family 19 protein n=1 Tax=Novilysobacter erysipheiresistens TaxID=1749332 RepID=A0ABU7YXN4_9GAMM